MRLRQGFEIVNVADEYLAVPIGKETEQFKGVVVLNEAVAFLLNTMKNNVTLDQLVDVFVDNYEVEREKAAFDIKKMIDYLKEVNLIEN